MKIGYTDTVTGLSLNRLHQSISVSQRSGLLSVTIRLLLEHSRTTVGLAWEPLKTRLSQASSARLPLC